MPQRTCRVYRGSGVDHWARDQQGYTIGPRLSQCGQTAPLEISENGISYTPVCIPHANAWRKNVDTNLKEREHRITEDPRGELAT